MKSLKKPLVLAVVAFWALMTGHCGLETISGLGFLACSPQWEATPHLPTDCGDDNDACATVESGLYKNEEVLVTAVSAPVTTAAFALATDSSLGAAEPSLRASSSGPAALELAQVWQFALRAALPPRAPSRVS